MIEETDINRGFYLDVISEVLKVAKRKGPTLGFRLDDLIQLSPVQKKWRRGLIEKALELMIEDGLLIHDLGSGGAEYTVLDPTDARFQLKEPGEPNFVEEARKLRLFTPEAVCLQTTPQFLELEKYLKTRQASKRLASTDTAEAHDEGAQPSLKRSRDPLSTGLPSLYRNEQYVQEGSSVFLSANKRARVDHSESAKNLQNDLKTPTTGTDKPPLDVNAVYGKLIKNAGYKQELKLANAEIAALKATLQTQRAEAVVLEAAYERGLQGIFALQESLEQLTITSRAVEARAMQGRTNATPGGVDGRLELSAESITASPLNGSRVNDPKVDEPKVDEPKINEHK